MGIKVEGNCLELEYAKEAGNCVPKGESAASHVNIQMLCKLDDLKKEVQQLQDNKASEFVEERILEIVQELVKDRKRLDECLERGLIFDALGDAVESRAALDECLSVDFGVIV